LASTVGVNEFIFTALLDELDASQLDALLDVVSDRSGTKPHSRYTSPVELAEAIVRIRNEVIPLFLEECADRVLAANPTMVGFTCMFDQTIGSIALARILKRRKPDLLIVAGGYALHGEPGEEILRRFTEIDAVVVGDGEPCISQLAAASVGHVALLDVPNVRTRERPHPRTTALAPLDDSLVPDFDDWFRDTHDLDADKQVRVITSALPVEGSRGCWWGQVSHCTFCGIDDETLKYRAHSAAGVLTTLRSLRERFGDLEFRFSDYILARSHYKELLPLLTAESPKFRLSCEIKANQTAARMRQLSDAGFIALQPGVESFSNAMLKRMDKGVRAIQNVATLKYGYVNKIVIHYNILFGFPDEDPEWTKEMLPRLPTLYHLSPPISRSCLQVTRYSPLHTQPARFGVRERYRHDWRYDVMFSPRFLNQTGFDLDKYVYTFQRRFDQSPALAEAHRLLVHQVEIWKSQHRARDVELTYEPTRTGGVLVTDSRFGPPVQTELTKKQWAFYLAIDETPILESRIPEKLPDTSPAQCRKLLDELDDKRLVWREDGMAFGLAVPAHVHRSHAQSQWKRSWLSLQ
jgi:ribosomal peptide maturation radical SAM protein 1